MPDQGSAVEKASWKDISRGAAKPPSDDKDEAPSGLATENFKGSGPPASDATPANTANTKTGSPGPNAKGGLAGFSKKQQALLLKALENPEVVKALDQLDAAGAFKAVDGAESAKADDDCGDEEHEHDAPPTDDKMYRSVRALEKQVSDLTKMVTSLTEGKSDLQKSGYVQVGQPTPKPPMASMEKQPAYDQRQAAIQKGVANYEETGEMPDFDRLAATRLSGVLR